MNVISRFAIFVDGPNRGWMNIPGELTKELIVDPERKRVIIPGQPLEDAVATTYTAICSRVVKLTKPEVADEHGIEIQYYSQLDPVFRPRKVDIERDDEVKAIEEDVYTFVRNAMAQVMATNVPEV